MAEQRRSFGWTHPERPRRRFGWYEAEEQPPDFTKLDQQWVLAERALQLAGEYGRIPEGEYIYHLNIGVLKQRIKSCWHVLDEPEVLEGCLRLVYKMHDDPAATLLGYAILVIALLEGDHHEEAELVADLQAAYRAQIDGDDATEEDTDEPGAAALAADEAGPATD